MGFTKADIVKILDASWDAAYAKLEPLASDGPKQPAVEKWTGLETPPSTKDELLIRLRAGKSTGGAPGRYNALTPQQLDAAYARYPGKDRELIEAQTIMDTDLSRYSNLAEYVTTLNGGGKVSGGSGI